MLSIIIRIVFVISVIMNMVKMARTNEVDKFYFYTLSIAAIALTLGI